MNFLKYSKDAMPGKNCNVSWKEGRPWLMYLEETKVMTCSSCIEFYGESAHINPNLKGQNTFLVGCNNMRLSALLDNEKCKAHQDACRTLATKTASTVEVSQSKAGKSLTLLKSTQRAKLSLLFRNVHAIVKNNKPLREYVWLYDLDVRKDLFEGETYRSQKSALPFLSSISDIEPNRQQRWSSKPLYLHF